MTSISKAMNAYNQAVETIPQAQQIVMLYDGILQSIDKAKLAIAERRINDRYLAVQKATTIIEALQGCLDHENGGDIAPQLDRLYTCFMFQLQTINIENDPHICDALMANIRQMRDSWATIAASGPTTTTSKERDQPPASSPVTA